MRRPTAPLALAAAVFVLAGGWIHLTEWLDVYRDVPDGVPGAAVVRIGFPVNVAISVAAAGALLAGIRRPRLLVPAVVAAALFQAGSLAALFVSRTGSLLGWEEPIWTTAAEQTRAVEIGALVCLTLLAVTERLARTRRLELPLRRSGAEPRPA